jgi:hypothetical protein
MTFFCRAPGRPLRPSSPDDDIRPPPKQAFVVALFFHGYGSGLSEVSGGIEGSMGGERVYEVVQNDSGWVLRRHDRTPLVEFPTRGQALRAGIAVSRDEGLARLWVRRSDGGVEEVDPRFDPLPV